MAETAVAVVMTCVESPRNDVDGLDNCSFSVHAVMEPPGDLEGIYIAKIVEPAFIVDQVISEPIWMERDEFFFKTVAKIEPDTRVVIEISLAGPSTPAVAEPGSGV
jgi:hypothetical protein